MGVVISFCLLSFFSKFRLSYYPHLLSKFDSLIDEIFGAGQQKVLADFKGLEEVENPSYFIHICKKKE